MDAKTLTITLFTMVFLLLGFAFSYFIPIQTPFAQIPFVAIVIAFFLAGTIYFGYLSFIPALIFGLQLGADKNAAIFLYILPLFIAAYAGIKLASALQEDLFKKKNHVDQLQTTLLLLFFAILLALIIEAALPTIIELWPKDFLGMNVTENKGLAGIIDDLAKRIRR